MVSTPKKSKRIKKDFLEKIEIRIPVGLKSLIDEWSKMYNHSSSQMIRGTLNKYLSIKYTQNSPKSKPIEYNKKHTLIKPVIAWYKKGLKDKTILVPHGSRVRMTVRLYSKMVKVLRTIAKEEKITLTGIILATMINEIYNGGSSNFVGSAKKLFVENNK